MPEPRDPLLKVLTYFASYSEMPYDIESFDASGGLPHPGGGAAPVESRPPKQRCGDVHNGLGVFQLCNDPSAGSPTETLLRLLLPLNDRVWIAFRP
jgi:hypothetical protein